MRKGWKTYLSDVRTSGSHGGYGHGEVGFDAIKMYGMVDGLVLFHRSRGKVS